MNTWRNDALGRNLAQAAHPESKIFRTLGPVVDSDQTGIWLTAHLERDSNCRFALDVVGLAIALYYMLATPFHFSYYYGPSTTRITNDNIISWLIDAVCYVECAIRLYTLRLKNERIARTTSTVTGTTTRFDDTLYVDNMSFICDIVGLLPIDLFVLLPGIPFSMIHTIRLVRLLRVPNIFLRIGQVSVGDYCMYSVDATWLYMYCP